MKVAGRQLQTILLVTAVMLLGACVVDEPTIQSTRDVGASATVETSPSAAPQFEPTVAVQPTPEPTPAPTATPPPPTPAPPPTPIGPTPLPTSVPADEYAPTPVAAGPVAVPVAGARFILSETRPVLQLGGHTLIYVDDERDAEVDIFTPVATAGGSPIADYGALIGILDSDPVFEGLMELSPVSLAGFPTRVFEGTAASQDRAFVTSLDAADDSILGWFPPARMRLWVIDHPSGAVIVSAESLENPGRYSEAVRLATEILSTITLG